MIKTLLIMIILLDALFVLSFFAVLSLIIFALIIWKGNDL